MHLRGGGEAQASSHDGVQKAFEPSRHVIVLDVDGTLYGAESGIEQQIVAHIHRFALSACEVTPEESDELHRKYGSTLVGLKAEKSLSKDLEERFYREVYGAIDYSRLLGGGAEGDASGYKHSSSVREILMRSGVRVAIASNSPSWHVDRVLAALGLAHVPLCAKLTPDLVGGLTKSDPLYWSPLLERYQPHRNAPEMRHVWGGMWGGGDTQSGHFRIDLLDDSVRNLDVAELVGIRGTLVSPGTGFPVEHALLTVCVCERERESVCV